MRGWHHLWVSLMSVICKEECMLGRGHTHACQMGRRHGAGWGNSWDAQGLNSVWQMQLSGAGALSWGQSPSLPDSVMHQWQVGDTGVTRLPPTPKADIPNDYSTLCCRWAWMWLQNPPLPPSQQPVPVDRCWHPRGHLCAIPALGCFTWVT